MSETREWRVELFAAIVLGDTAGIVAAFDGMRAEAWNAAGEIERERDAWRWLHWGHPEASWACACGMVNGGGINQCSGENDDCGRWRPMKAAILAEVQAGATYDRALVEKHRAFSLSGDSAP